MAQSPIPVEESHRLYDVPGHFPQLHIEVLEACAVPGTPDRGDALAFDEDASAWPMVSRFRVPRSTRRFGDPGSRARPRPRGLGRARAMR